MKTKSIIAICAAALSCIPAYSAQQTIGVGTTGNDGTGDTVRAAFIKVNSNFDELYEFWDTATGDVEFTFSTDHWVSAIADPVLAQTFVSSAVSYIDSADQTLKPVTIGSGLTFTAGTLAASGGGAGLASTDIDTSAELRAIVTDESGAGALIFAGGDVAAATATTASAGDNDTSVATTAFVKTDTRGSQTGTHAAPSTTNPLTASFTSIMHSVWYGATGTINLPAAAGYSGRAIMIYNTGAFTITIDPNGSEVVVRDGTAQTGGVNFTLSGGAGNYVAIICDGTRWITLGYKGTLTVGS